HLRGCAIDAGLLLSAPVDDALESRRNLTVFDQTHCLLLSLGSPPGRSRARLRHATHAEGRRQAARRVSCISWRRRAGLRASPTGRPFLASKMPTAVARAYSPSSYSR